MARCRGVAGHCTVKPSDKDKSHNFPENKLGRWQPLSLRGGKNSASDASDGRGRGGKQAVQGFSKQLVDQVKGQRTIAPKLRCTSNCDGITDTDEALDSGEGAKLGQGQMTTSEGRKTSKGGRGVTNRGRTAGKRNETWCMEALPGMSMRVGLCNRPGAVMANKAKTYGLLDWKECGRNGKVSDDGYHTVSGV